ncbi:MAG: McrB family protein [Planctomycetota bacterium]
MAVADIEEVLHNNQSVIFAADQAPFTLENIHGMTNTFCVLVPLMTVDGRPFDRPAQVFANHGRVWWMLLPEHHASQVRPGGLWTGELEHAPKPNELDPEKDRYQIRRKSATRGARDWVEILDLPVDIPNLSVLLSPEGLPFPHPTLGRVVLRGKSAAVGPLRASWDERDERLSFTALNLGKPTAWKIPSEILRPGEHYRQFSFKANKWDPGQPTREIRIQLLNDKHLELLTEKGQEVDAATDAQVIKWALGIANFSNREKTIFREALEAAPKAGDVEQAELPGRLERFRRLCANADRVRMLGYDVAEALTRQEAFGELIERHADRLAGRRVEELVGERTADIEAKLHELDERRARLEEEVAEVETGYDRRKREQEERLAAENQAWISDLERRSEDVENREGVLKTREKEIEERLSRVIDEYRTSAREIGDQIIAQLPILRRAGLGGPDGMVESIPERPASLLIPAHIDGAIEEHGMAESAFIQQFIDVVSRRGFVFDRDDLINFHVSAKVGLWTVVAGPSGIGKSSLPRLYAEALGAGEEYLSIPVRPDWLDDRDVIGAFNALSGRFEPAATGLVDHLIAAHEDNLRGRGGIYLVTLDEMNLARVEHYFAQFLSIMEEPPERRSLQLFSRGLERRGDPYTRYRCLPVGPNVRFVGTVNIDETTHFFSPKVLDRAAVLTLAEPDLERDPGLRLTAKDLAVTPVHLNVYRSWISGPEEAMEPVRAFVLELDRLLRPIRSGLAFRLRDRMLSYVASARDLLPEDRAIDLALSQSVLPRVRAHHPLFGEVVGNLAGLLPKDRFPRTGLLLEQLRSAEGAYDFFQLL